ncbi:beta-propeller fold lactonase family protein [Lachnospiraceae bacterium 54-53]
MSKTDIDFLVCHYGEHAPFDSGIMYVSFSVNTNTFLVRQEIKVDGKINFILSDKGKIYAPVQQRNRTGILVYEWMAGRLEEKDFIDTGLFYSYGVIRSGRGYFASFSSGADGVVDLREKKEKEVFKHDRGLSGRSHYINFLSSGYLYSVENELNKVYILAEEKERLKVVDSIDFNEDNPRLMPLHPKAPFAYLLTERSNRIIVYHAEQSRLSEIQNIKVPGAEVDKDFCGGIAVNGTGTCLCISIRGKNEIVLYKIMDDGRLMFLDAAACGKMPRDLLIKDEYVFVTCTDSDQIEVFKISGGQLKDLDTALAVRSPITFSVGGNI